jgi:alkanesulfonate monooxygenase SsuD/methylene tetrahydromethanopterin reductase-like flavin-dependent oxidoreductase (luciferase family)
MAATLDVICGGRLEIGLGTGWNKGEFNAYGYPFESPAARVRRLDEAAQIMKKMWTEESPFFKGKYYEIVGAYCRPKPIQKPHPPLMLAGGGEQLTLRSVARHANVCNFASWRGTPEDYRHKLEVLRQHCEIVGRNFSEIRKSWSCNVLIVEDENSAKKILKTYKDIGSERPPIFGTPEQCMEQIQRYIDVGVTFFIMRFMSRNFEKEVKLFANNVLSTSKRARESNRV